MLCTRVYSNELSKRYFVTSSLAVSFHHRYLPLTQPVELVDYLVDEIVGEFDTL